VSGGDVVQVRVRYPEVDAMGYLHHSRYLQYFEIGRVELLRKHGFSYAELERQGVFFVVVKAEVRYKAPARYDEELTLLTRVTRQTHVRYDHAYELRRGNTLLAADAKEVSACRVDEPQEQPTAQSHEGRQADHFSQASLARRNSANPSVYRSVRSSRFPRYQCG